MMRKTLPLAVLAGVLFLSLLIAVPALARGQGNPLGTATVYVTSQGLAYDSIITADPLPMEGPFQELVPTDDGLQTMYGPGDPGYLGGRWWIDVNGNDVQDEGDRFFLCPLLGPGYVP